MSTLAFPHSAWPRRAVIGALALSLGVAWSAETYAQPAQKSAAQKSGPQKGVAATPLTRLQVSCGVAVADDAPVADTDWLDAQIAHANLVFAPAGLHFTAVAPRALPAELAALETRADRDALGAHLLPDVINCFIVGSLRDVDEPEHLRRGVHWRPAGQPGAHVVIVAAYSGPWVLAHELGHFFGIRGHPPTEGNIMSYTPGTGPRTLSAAQEKLVRRVARRFVRSGELKPLPPPPAPTPADAAAPSRRDAAAPPVSP